MQFGLDFLDIFMIVFYFLIVFYIAWRVTHKEKTTRETSTHIWRM